MSIKFTPRLLYGTTCRRTEQFHIHIKVTIWYEVVQTAHFGSKLNILDLHIQIFFSVITSCTLTYKNFLYVSVESAVDVYMV